MIRVEQVCKSFSSTVAVDRVSLRVREGEIFGLVGPDGAGKTTLLRMICGLIAPDSGYIAVMELTPSQLERNRDKLGYMPQRFSLYGDLTVWENIEFFGSLYGLSVRAIRERAKEILKITGLCGFESRFSDQLSGGMKQKLALACALLTRPRLLVLDEPTCGVDPVSRREIWGIIYRLNAEGMTVLLSTPYMDEAELCHTVGFLSRGKLVIAASPVALKKGFPYRLLEVRPAVAEPAVFEGLDGVIEVSPCGDGYHLLVEDMRTAREAVSRALAERGMESFDIREASPSMEDVYVVLAEKGVKYGHCGRDVGTD